MIDEKDYLADPCGSASLPLWKTLQIEVPDNIMVIRDDEYVEGTINGSNEPYFKMIHNLENVSVPVLSDDYVLSTATDDEFAAHIQECYESECLSVEEIGIYKKRQVYDTNLWIAIREQKTRKIVASGIGELDKSIGEGTLEWIQVSTAHRHKGLGKYVVAELLSRLRGRAEFVTVSGKLNSPSNPYELYIACGFSNPVIWYIVHKD